MKNHPDQVLNDKKRDGLLGSVKKPHACVQTLVLYAGLCNSALVSFLLPLSGSAVNLRTSRDPFLGNRGGSGSDYKVSFQPFCGTENLELRFQDIRLVTHGLRNLASRPQSHDPAG